MPSYALLGNLNLPPEGDKSIETSNQGSDRFYFIKITLGPDTGMIVNPAGSHRADFMVRVLIQWLERQSGGVCTCMPKISKGVRCGGEGIAVIVFYAGCFLTFSFFLSLSSKCMCLQQIF